MINLVYIIYEVLTIVTVLLQLAMAELVAVYCFVLLCWFGIQLRMTE